MSIFSGIARAVCRRFHRQHLERVSPGHRKCTKCGRDYRSTWGPGLIPAHQLPK